MRDQRHAGLLELCRAAVLDFFGRGDHLMVHADASQRDAGLFDKLLAVLQYQDFFALAGGALRDLCIHKSLASARGQHVHHATRAPRVPDPWPVRLRGHAGQRGANVGKPVELVLSRPHIQPQPIRAPIAKAQIIDSSMAAVSWPGALVARGALL